MAHGTLENLKHSAFVRTDPILAVLIGKHLLQLPQDPFSVYDPTSGEGDLFYACAHAKEARLFGSEISADRAAVSRQRWPHATIVTSAFEAVSMRGRVDLILANPPYFLQNGQRASLRILADVGEWLRPGGILVAILTARSDWNGFMINHWLRWYDQVRAWKFPDRTSSSQEGAFDDYKQICVIGVRRPLPTAPDTTEKKRLQGYQWKEPETSGQSGWRYGVAPPVLPAEPLADPYRVPSSREAPRLLVRNADEATLLYALDKSGTHFSSTWQTASTWPDEGYLGSPSMPYTGEAHIAAEVMIGGLDGEIVWGPGTGADAEPHLFTAFVGQEWVAMPVEDELKEKLHEQGCIRVELKQLQDKPILGVLNLHRGTVRYYQGEEVFRFLEPWLGRLSGRVIEKRRPLYRLDPADWELAVLSRFGTDKRLPNAAFAGLAIPQLHRVFAMGRSLDVKGRTAIQGEPGTGKTRMAGAVAGRQAYRWRHRGTIFRHAVQPHWIAGMRRAWLKNPRTRAMLGLEPVYGHRTPGENRAGSIVFDRSTRHVVAYRDREGNLLTPEDAGPHALPVLITTPLKVTKEYGKEIAAAFPQAEVMQIESYRDIPRWLDRCVSSAAPVVFGIFSHSTTRAFGCEWQPAVHEKHHIVRRPVLDPPESLRENLTPLYEERRGARKLVGYQVKGTGKLLTEEQKVSHFSCPDCGGIISAVPGKLNQPSDEEQRSKIKSAVAHLEKRSEADGQEAKQGSISPGNHRTEPVTSRTWFTTKPRWCRCSAGQRGQEREARGKLSLKTALWQDDWVKTTKRKFPRASFAEWSAAMTVLEQRARAAKVATSTRELASQVRQSEERLNSLVAVALADPDAASALLDRVEQVDRSVFRVHRDLSAREAELVTLLAGSVGSRNDLGPLIERASLTGFWLLAVGRGNRQLLQELLTPDEAMERAITHLLDTIKEIEAHLAEVVAQAIRRDGSHTLLITLVEATRTLVDWAPWFFRAAYARASLESRPTTPPARKAAKEAISKNNSMLAHHGLRLSPTERSGAIAVEEPDLDAHRGYQVENDAHGRVVAYHLGHQGRTLFPIYGRFSRRVVGYSDERTGKVIMRTRWYDFRMPPPDSFSPYEYLYRFYRGTVALSVVDESHNGRGRSTDIAHSHHCAMLAAQTRALTSGSHYGGDIIGFYHYWFRYHPAFWLRLGFGWNDAEQALAHYGVIQQWTKEYESEARKGSGQTNVYVSTIPAPGLSAKLIPGLLEDLTYLTVLDVGAHMPPKREIPKGISLSDPSLKTAIREAEQRYTDAQQMQARLQQRLRHLSSLSSTSDVLVEVASLEGQIMLAGDEAKQTAEQLEDTRRWVAARDLDHAYSEVVSQLEELAEAGNTAARLAQGTVPRWFAVLPCDRPFEVYHTPRGDWGDKEEPELVIQTPQLSWDYLYPLERWVMETVRAELAEGRRIMLYYEQNAIRSMAKRLEWVLRDFHPWTLPNSVEAEDRQQAILDAVAAGHHTVIVPYRRVNEGLNLQQAIDTIIWVELAMNLFHYFQASQRAWRLGKENEVRVYLPFYIGTAVHTKMRKLGGQSGAAAAFAGEPARGELIKHVGADQTTLARLSASLADELADGPGAVDEDLAAIEAAFDRRNKELEEALRQGRQWFGIKDTLPERLALTLASHPPDPWASHPSTVFLEERRSHGALPAPAVAKTARVIEPSAFEQPEFLSASVAASPIAPPTSPAPAIANEPTSTPAPPVPRLVSVFPMPLHFGDEEDIRRVRQKLRAHPPRRGLKLKNPTMVKHIPALVEPLVVPPNTMILPSIWDSAFAPLLERDTPLV